MSKHLLITGGAGFIASHVIDYFLANTDWYITSLDRLDYSGNLNRLNEIVSEYHPNDQQRVQIIFHDLKAELNPHVVSMIHKFGIPEYVFHLAAGSHVDRSITDPREFVMDNMVGTLNILEYIRNYNSSLELFINFGTDEIFGPAPVGVNYKEYDRTNPNNPYAATKEGAEALCVAYQNTYQLPIMCTHTMNVFGERQNPEKFIPMCIKKIIAGESVTIHANKSLTQAGSRFYIHASDVANALHFIVRHPLLDCINNDVFRSAKCPKYNIVGKEEIDNLTLAQLIAQALNKPLRYEMVDFHSSRPGHDLRYALDGSLLKREGWEPTISLTNRIQQVVEWTVNNPRWYTY